MAFLTNKNKSTVSAESEKVVSFSYDERGNNLVCDRKGEHLVLKKIKKLIADNTNFKAVFNFYQSNMNIISIILNIEQIERTTNSINHIYNVLLESIHTNRSALEAQQVVHLIKYIKSNAIFNINDTNIFFDFGNLEQGIKDFALQLHDYKESKSLEAKYSDKTKSDAIKYSVNFDQNSPKTTYKQEMKSQLREWISFASYLLNKCSTVNEGQNNQKVNEVNQVIDPLDSVKYKRLRSRFISTGKLMLSHEGIFNQPLSDENQYSLDNLPPLKFLKENFPIFDVIASNQIISSYSIKEDQKEREHEQQETKRKTLKSFHKYMVSFSEYMKDCKLSANSNDLISFLIGVSPESLISLHKLRIALRTGDHTCNNYRDAMRRQDNGYLEATQHQEQGNLIAAGCMLGLMVKHFKAIGIDTFAIPVGHEFLEEGHKKIGMESHSSRALSKTESYNRSNRDISSIQPTFGRSIIGKFFTSTLAIKKNNSSDNLLTK